MRPAPRPTARCAPSFSVSGITEPSLGTKTKLNFWGSKLRPSPKQQSSEFSSLASTFSHHFHCGFISAVGLGSSCSNILPFTSVFPGPFLAFPPGLGYFSCFCSLSWTLLPILTLSRIKTYLAAASFCPSWLHSPCPQSPSIIKGKFHCSSGISSSVKHFMVKVTHSHLLHKSPSLSTDVPLILLGEEAFKHEPK